MRSASGLLTPTGVGPEADDRGLYMFWHGGFAISSWPMELNRAPLGTAGRALAWAGCIGNRGSCWHLGTSDAAGYPGR
jgi:hypothetical protein